MITAELKGTNYKEEWEQKEEGDWSHIIDWQLNTDEYKDKHACYGICYLCLYSNSLMGLMKKRCFFGSHCPSPCWKMVEML